MINKIKENWLIWLMTIILVLGIALLIKILITGGVK